MVAGVASLEEIDRHYSIVDMFDANEALDLKEEAEWLAANGER